MATDMHGIARTILKQTDLTIQEYQGLARDGELVVDLNPGPSQYSIYIGRANGTMVPTGGGGGGGGNSGYADFAGVANLANFVPASGVIGVIANANYAAFSGIANRASTANSADSVNGANVVGPVPIALIAYSVNGANVVGAVANAVYANSANTANLANVANTVLSVPGANVVGPVGSANVAITVSGNAQPNITSVGTLTTLTVAGNTAVGNLSTGGRITANGNITGGNLLTGGVVTAAGNITGQNFNTTGTVTANTGVVTDTITSRTGSMTLAATGTDQNITLDPSGTGFIDVSNARIANLQSPVATNDAATKGYVDALSQGLTIKESANCATTADLGGTYNNGAAGVGATLTLGAPLTVIDGFTLTAGDRILVKNQAVASQNGVYEYTNSTTLTRAADSDTNLELQSGSFLFVQAGTVNASSGYVQTSDVNTVGTDACDYTQFSYAGAYSNGAGIDLVGTQFSLSDTTVTPGIYGSASLVPVITVNSKGQLTAVSNVSVAADVANLTGNTLSANVLYSSLTTLGTLTQLTVAGPVDLGNVANLTITGGNLGDVLTSDGAGGATWSVVPSSNTLAAGTSNIFINNNGNIVAGVAGTGGVFTITDMGIETGNANIGTVDVVDLNVTATANLNDLIVNGLANLGDIANITIGGGNVGEILTTDGNGTLSWTTISASPAGNIGELQFNNAGLFGATPGIVYSSGVLSIVGNANLSIGGGTAGQYLKKGGSSVEWGNITAGGANAYFQINDNGSLGGISAVQWLNDAMTFSNIANLRIPGGLPGDKLVTDGTGNLSWSAGGGGGGTPGGVNRQIQFNDNGVFGGVPIMTWTTNGQITFGSNANMRITGGANGQVLMSDGTGNVNWDFAGAPGGTNTQLQFNNNAVMGGIPFATYNGTHLVLGSNANVQITGGLAGQVLGTDGAGNLSWTAGGGTPGGANTQMQFNNNGVFGGITFATFDGNALTLGSNANVKVTGGTAGQVLSTDGTGNLSWTAIAAAAGGLDTQVQFNDGGLLGGMTTVTYDGTNINLGDITTVKIGGGSNGYMLQTDGAGLLSWVAPPSPSRIANGSSNVTIGTVDGNVTVGVAGVANVVQITSTNVISSGNIISSANISGANVTATNNVSATLNVLAGGNVIGGNVIANTNVLATANVIGNNFQANANITANFNVMAVGNVIGGNLSSNLNISAAGNITANANISAVGNVRANGSVVTDTVTSRTGSIAINATGADQNITLTPTGTGYIDATASLIKNVDDPVDAQDAATKAYVDAFAQGLQPKAPVQCATLADLAGTYDNGVAGVGATITLGASLTTIDGYTVSPGDRVLVKDQTNAFENGIYEVTTPTELTRTADYDTAAEMPEGTSVFVENGTVNGTASFVQIGAVLTVGADPVDFVGFGKASEYSAGTGLTLVGTQFKLANTAVVAGTYGNATHIPAVTVDAQGRITAVSNTLLTANAETLTGTFLANGVINSNLTTLGTLTSLTVNGISNLSANSNVKITGGSNGQALITDGTGNLSWGNVTSAGGSNTQLQYNDGGNLAGIPTATYAANVLNLGSNANIAIGGGSNGYLLVTDGLGNLRWEQSLVAIQPTIEFVAAANGTGQTFTNAGIGNITSNAQCSVYVNGVLARVSDYSISGTTLTFSRMIQTGDEINVSPFGITGVQQLSKIANGASDVSVALNGNITANVNGNLKLTVNANGIATTGVVANTLGVSGVSNLGAVANVKITGGLSGQVLTTDGTGNLSWAAGGGGGGGGTSYGAIQFTAAANGTGQVFSNVNLQNISSASTCSVYVNGVLTPTSTYTVTGSDLTMLRSVSTGDVITVGAFGVSSMAVTGAGGADTELQYNNAGNLGGVAGVTSNGGAVIFAGAGNISIAGGSNGQVLTTDGTGNLSWGNVTSSGGTTSYVNVSLTTPQTITALGTTILWNSSVSGSIPYDPATGEFTLTAGVTYELTSGIQIELLSGTTYFNYQWYNVTTGSYIGTMGASESLNSPSSYGNGTAAHAVITPSVTTKVSVRVVQKAGTNADIRANFSYAQINQIGTTAGTIAGPIVVTSTISIAASGTAPTKATTPDIDNITIIDDGSGWCDLIMKYYSASGAGSATGSGIYYFSLPGGYQFNTTIQPIDTSIGVTLPAADRYKLIPTAGVISHSTTNIASLVWVIPVSPTQFKIIVNSPDFGNQVNSGYFGISVPNTNYSVRFKFKKV